MRPQVGEMFDGTVSSIGPHGPFVERPAGGTGLLFGNSVDVGSTVRVEVLAVDDDSHRFSLRRV